jgi:hypothetical protein
MLFVSLGGEAALSLRVKCWTEKICVINSNGTVVYQNFRTQSERLGCKQSS